MSMETCQSSGLKSASAAIATRKAKLYAITLIQAAAASTAIVYDNATTNSGTVLAQINNNTNTSTQTLIFNIPVEAANGIYVAITGASANYICHYTLL